MSRHVQLSARPITPCTARSSASPGHCSNVPQSGVYQRIKYVTLDEREEEEKLIAERTAERIQVGGAPQKSAAGEEEATARPKR